MNKPLCLNCGFRMDLVEVNIIVVSYFKDGTPYYARSANLYECPACHEKRLLDFQQDYLWHSRDKTPIPNYDNSIRIYEYKPGYGELI